MTVAWQCGRFRFEFEPGSPGVMGVLNVTPDSFSDGGRFAEPLAALAHARLLADEGAVIIDVGGESTRPGSDEVSPVEELARIRPVVARLAADGLVVSVDTRHAEVARACVEEGAAIINDVSGFRDPAMFEIATSCDAGLVIMHMLGEPKTMQREPRYEDVVVEVAQFLAEKAQALVDAGVSRERIAIDPGIGFGKTLEHNIALLRGLPELVALGYPVVVGVSRKRMIGELTGVEQPDRRLGGSIAAALWAAARGASVVRVHDVGQTLQALKVAHALDVGR